MASTAYDLAAVPEWARESIARTAREHPENLPGQLSHVAEVEAARRYEAEHPAPQPPPDSPRDWLHLAAIEAWQAIAHGQPAPGMDPAELFQDLHDVFAAGTTITPVEQLIEDWYELARECGINVTGAGGELRPDIDQAITRTVTAAIWFGITTGYLPNPPQVPGMKDAGKAAARSF
jgi:hypothetical protein